MKLFEVKIQDPETGEWFEKTQKSFESYFSIIDVIIDNYFKNGQCVAKYNTNEQNVTYEIQLNDRIISNCETFKKIIEKSLNAIKINSTNIYTTEQWNEAYNYCLFCNRNSFEPDLTIFGKIFGVTSNDNLNEIDDEDYVYFPNDGTCRIIL